MKILMSGTIMGAVKLTFVKDADWKYPFEKSVCNMQVRGEFDPFPAYAADKQIVSDTLELVSSIWPLKHNLEVYVANKELVDRVNAFATYNWDYYSREAVAHKKAHDVYPWYGIIVISGKRIPIHPGMVRHLVAHEYGHQVMYEMVAASDDKNDPYGDRDKLMKEYCKLRGMKYSKKYGGGHWHDSPGEVFANDFRTLVCGQESEYWPHPQLIHPKDHPELIEWWRVKLKEKKKNG